jgi:archaellum biogenesis ATPase FlaH
MLDVGYPYGGPFQQRLLALLVQHPKEMSSIIQPRYFEIPTLVDIARVVSECHARHPDAAFSYIVLKEAVRASLSRKQMENWSYYEKDLKAAFQPLPKDTSVLRELATKFSRNSEFRNALVLAEKYVNAGAHDKVLELFQKAQELANVGPETTAHWSDLPHPLDYSHEAIEWIVEGLIPAKHVIAISGEEGVGKTLLLLAMARSITEGRDFLDMRVFARKVVYLGLDVSKVTLQHYMKMLRWIPGDDFRILTMWTDPEAPMLDRTEQLEWLYRYVMKYQPVLIFDTLRDFFDGEENSSTETKPILDAVKRMRALGGTVILIAHPAKRGNAAIRGTNNISQKVDVSYFVERVQSQGKDMIRLTCPTKNRAGSQNVSLTIQKLFIPTPAGPYFTMREFRDVGLPAEPKPNRLLDAIVGYLRANPGKNQEEIKTELKVGDRRLKQVLSEGETKGRLRRERGQRNVKRWYVVDSESHQAQEQISSVVEEVSRALAKPSS